MDLKSLLISRLDKVLSREGTAIVLGAYGLLEAKAPAEWWSLFTVGTVAVLQISKAVANIKRPPTETSSAALVDKQAEETDK